jgi:hypothetical protein
MRANDYALFAAPSAAWRLLNLLANELMKLARRDVCLALLKQSWMENR